jgi:DNA primase
MARIPGEAIEEIRSHFDIVEVISSYIDLKKAGRNYVGFCPFHSEKKPSFTVSAEKQIFYCFGCQSGGNLFSFVMNMEDCSFPEAVRFLADKSGISIESVSATPAEKKELQARDYLIKMNSLAQKYFEEMLWKTSKGKKVLHYLLERGLTEQTIREFHLGYAAESWQGLTGELLKRGLNLDLALRGGLVKKSSERYYDYFRDRLIFPISDSHGSVVGFGGRVLGEGEPKYLNSPESPLFSKSKNLYGLHLAMPYIRRDKEALLVEGYMDVILLHQHGVKDAVAPLGTSLTENQISLLRGRLGKLTLAFDGDTGGEIAALRGLELLKNEGCQVLVAQFPEGQDPADFVMEHGEENFRREILQKARSLVDYRLYVRKKRHDLTKEEGRVSYWKEARSILSDINESMEREEYLKKIAKEINVSLEVLREDLEKILWSFSPGQKKALKEVKSQTLSLKELVEKELLTCLFKYPRHLTLLRENEINEGSFTEGPYREIASYLFQLDRDGKNIETAAFLSYFSDQEMHKLIIRMALPFQIEEESKVVKIIKDCIRKIKAISWAEERQMLTKSLQSTVNRGEVSAKLQRIHDLKKREEELCRSGEGEDFDG